MTNKNRRSDVARHLLAGVTLAALSGPALAQTPAAAAAINTVAAEAEPATVDEIIVNGQQFKGQATPLALSTAPAADIASVTVLSGEDISRQTLANNIDIFRSIPGVQVGDFGQVGIAQGVSFRGWPGAADSSAVAFYLDGAQRNEASGTGSNGYLDINPVIPELLDQVTVVKGPFNTRYGGNFALAGSFIATTVDEMPNTLALSAGSYGHYRGLATVGFANDKISYYTAVRVVSDDGYQTNADQNQYTTFSKIGVPLGEGQLSVSLQTYNLKHGSPGYLDLINLETGAISRRDAVSATDGGAKDQYTVVANYRQGDERQGVEATAYGETMSRHRFATFTPTPQQNTRNRRNFYGATLDPHWTFQQISGFDALLAVGLNVRHDDIDTVRQPSLNGVAIETATPLDAGGYGRANISQTQAGGYGSLVIKRDEWLKLSLGVRYDHTEYNIQDQYYVAATNSFAQRRTSKQTSKFSPKIGLAISPVPEVILFANYGQSVASPDALREVVRVVGSIATPTLRTQEVGITYNPAGGRIHLQVSAYDTTNSDEFVIMLQQSVNQGKSKRRGYDIEGSALAYDGERLKVRAYANYSGIHARLNTGQHISAVADWVGSYGLHADYALDGGDQMIRFDLGQQWTGPQALNVANTFRSDRYSRITTKLSWELPELHNLKLWTEGTYYPGSTYDEFGFVSSNRAYVTSIPKVRLNVGVNVNF